MDIYKIKVEIKKGKNIKHSKLVDIAFKENYKKNRRWYVEGVHYTCNEIIFAFNNVGGAARFGDKISRKGYISKITLYGQNFQDL